VAFTCFDKCSTGNMRGTNRIGDFPADEFFPTAWELVVKEDPRADEYAMALPVVYRYPVAIDLGDSVGAPRIEGNTLVLRYLSACCASKHVHSWRLAAAKSYPVMRCGEDL